MRWTSVVWVSCLLPVLAGCSSARHAVQYVTQSVTSDNSLLHADRAAGDGLRRDAQSAWHTVVARHPQRVFSDDYRDGFVDGYAGFLDRGEASQPPAVPPVPYERYKKYFGPDGHSLVRDYYLGFQYGAEVAGATGRRPRTGAPDKPAPQPVPKPSDVPPAPETGKFGEPRKSSDEPPPLLPPRGGTGDGTGRAIPPLPKPEVPVIRPFNPDLTGGGKFAPSPVLSDLERLPAPYPPLPVSEPLLVPLAVRDEPKSTIPPVLGPLLLPVPLSKASLSASDRTPSVLDHIPVIPLQYPPK
jgi:hypothetical protein